MTILTQLNKIANQKQSLLSIENNARSIGIGLGDELKSNLLIIEIVQNFIKQFPISIALVGRKATFQVLQNHIANLSLDIKIVQTESPANWLIDSIQAKSIHAIIRGSLSSTEFLKVIRNIPLLDINSNKFENNGSESKQINSKERQLHKTMRLALLESNFGYQFFYAPVGIDEANSFNDRYLFIEQTIHFLKKLQIIPKIALLSGGRIGDLGRDPRIDDNIQSTIKLTQDLQHKYPDIDIDHYEILIENIISQRANMVLAPDGISGNLIYRTLVHLGGGNAYGAVFMSLFNLTGKILIDTSRVANKSEYEGALKLAYALL